jgi:hypothetical protein
MIPIISILSPSVLRYFFTWRWPRSTAETCNLVLTVYIHKDTCVDVKREFLLWYHSCHLHNGMLYHKITFRIIKVSHSHSYLWLSIALSVETNSVVLLTYFVSRRLKTHILNFFFNTKRRTKSRSFYVLLRGRRDTDGKIERRHN